MSQFYSLLLSMGSYASAERLETIGASIETDDEALKLE